MTDKPVPAEDPAARALRALVPGGIRRHELRRDSRTLRWFEAGAGVPTIVLEPGAASPATTWAPILAPLAARFRVVGYDRAGYGLSDPPDQLTLDLQIDDLAALAAELGGGCVIAGHSWGGLLAQLVSWARPDLVAALVLIDPSHEQMWPDEPAESSVSARAPAGDGDHDHAADRQDRATELLRQRSSSRNCR